MIVIDPLHILICPSLILLSIFKSSSTLSEIRFLDKSGTNLTPVSDLVTPSCILNATVPAPLISQLWSFPRITFPLVESLKSVKIDLLLVI
ncbi:hypothetical protein CsatA_008999 [Cannabis sativa]